MKHNPTLQTDHADPSEDEIREYAYHLYEQSSYIPGHDVDNWEEARACLKARIAPHDSHRRLHHHLSTTEGRSALGLTF